MSIKGKLNRLKNHLSLESVPNKEEASSPTFQIPSFDSWKDHGFRVYESKGGYCFVKKKTYPLDFQIGRYGVKDFQRAVRIWQQYNGIHPLSAKGYKESDLFFFDTESTGLGSGAGNHLFILGHARIEQEQLVLIQHILPEPGFEVALYESFLNQCNVKALVTYNGKAFDWPLLQAKHSLIRNEVAKLPSFGHFDLYHACKRLFKHELPSMKLSIIEQEVLEITREDDVPGYLSGMIYQDFLERKDPEGIFSLCEHNERDILALVSLYTHLSFLVHQQTKAVSSVAFEMGRWEAASGNANHAINQLQILADTDNEWNSQAKIQLASQYKKIKQIEEAIPLWTSLAVQSSGIEKINSCIELAKWMEHTKKDFNEALKFTVKALEEAVENKKLNSKKRKSLYEELMKRKLRLLRKLTNSFPG
ncbi:MAG TPA: ribonuclease H-like domain-containing protein [Bacillus sp. (in: firmicutes)]|nr:ribonuclease H-like domain-containing protein [Bacillus sp. (in: firmicutes)]